VKNGKRLAQCARRFSGKTFPIDTQNRKIGMQNHLKTLISLLSTHLKRTPISTNKQTVLKWQWYGVLINTKTSEKYAYICSLKRQSKDWNAKSFKDVGSKKTKIPKQGSHVSIIYNASFCLFVYDLPDSICCSLFKYGHIYASIHWYIYIVEALNTHHTDCLLLHII
jgi:hypothetical protein